MTLFGLAPGFFAVVMVVGVLGFVLSSIFGVGGAVLLIPLLAQRMPAAQAVGLVAPVMLVNNLLKTFVFRAHVDKKATLLVSGLALPASFIGAYFTARFDDRVILVGVAVLILLSIVVERGLDRKIRVTPLSLFLWGGVTGAVSGLCGAAGPPTAIGLRGYGLEREAFVGTVSAFAVLMQLAKIPAYVATGSLPPERFALAAWLSLVGALSVLAGPRLLAKVPKHGFAIGLDALLAVSAVWILVDVMRR